jgi:hypothetical protein
MARERPIPYAGFGFWNGRQYWESWQIFQIFGLITTHDCIIYPGQTRWQEVAREMALIFHPDLAAAVTRCNGSGCGCDGVKANPRFTSPGYVVIRRSGQQDEFRTLAEAKAAVTASRDAAMWSSM